MKHREQTEPSHLINTKRLRARHQSGPCSLLRFYPKSKLKQTLGIPFVISAVLSGLLFWSDIPLRDNLLHLIELSVRIFPDILGVLLGGFAIFFGFQDRAFLNKTTIPGEGPLTLYQKIIFAFTFTLVLQSLTLITAFLFQLFAEIHVGWMAPAYPVINRAGLWLLVLLMLVSLFSIYQMVMIIFGLAQNYHLHLVLRDKLKKRKGERQGISHPDDVDSI